MLATSLQSCAYKSVFTSDKTGERILCKARQVLASGLIAGILFFSEFGRKPLDYKNIDFEEVSSALMSPTHEPYRAPLRIVTLRRPVGTLKYPDRADLGNFNISFHVCETLECGHRLTVYIHDLEPLTAKRRRCRECLEAALPPKKPASSVGPDSAERAA